MDLISKIPSHLPLRETVEPTIAAFYPLLEKNQHLITDIVQKTFKYGETDRHCLDVYFPPTQTPPGEKTPVLFSVYGGAFVSGSRSWGPPLALFMACVGAFFARRGFITIIPDYRLAPEVQYPKQVEDVLESMKWVVSHSSDLISETTPNPDVESLVLIGHSAGAAHITTLIFHPTLLPFDSDLRAKIKAVVPMSGPFHYVSSSGEGDRFSAYWGTEDKAREQSVLSLTLASLNTLPKEKLPKFLLVEAEDEPRWIFNAGVDYRRLLEWHLNEPVGMVVCKGHNHCSLFCCLSSGEGEEWAIQTSDWVWKVLRGKEGLESAGAEILTDVKGLEAGKCLKCSQQRVRSFVVEQEMPTSVISKTYAICLSCGHKWVTE